MLKFSLFEFILVLYLFLCFHSLIICITCLLLIHKVSSENVSGVEGESVVLRCEPKKAAQFVFWKFRNAITVSIIEDGVIDNEQDPAYKGRVETVNKENYSIKINKVKKSDEGPYTCSDLSAFTLNVYLTVQEKRGIEINKSNNGKPPRRADSALIFLLGCVLLYSFIL